MKNVIKLAVYAGVGLYDKMREEIDELVRRGELKRQEGDDLIEQVEAKRRGKVQELTEKVERNVKRAVEKLPQSATRRHVELLEAHVRDLENRVQRLEIGDLAESQDLTPT